MNKINCIIVDDDEMIRIDLERKISSKPFLHLVASCSSAIAAAEILLKEKIDLVFLDIMMPEMTGMQFLQSLSSNRPQIIFVTSEKQFAAEAFEYEVTDFLVKPVSDERFLKAVMRASALVHAPVINPANENHLFVKVNSSLVKINIAEILYIEAMADYVTIHTAENRYTVHSTMKTIQESLPASKFFRVHNSYIVNLERISIIEDNMVMINKKLLPVSRSRVKPLMQRLNLIS
ncbi:MAG: LytTR family DNA-binding domain-containing protein [Bacteroidia bacterium]